MDSSGEGDGFGSEECDEKGEDAGIGPIEAIFLKYLRADTISTRIWVRHLDRSWPVEPAHG